MKNITEKTIQTSYLSSLLLSLSGKQLTHYLGLVLAFVFGLFMSFEINQIYTLIIAGMFFMYVNSQISSILHPAFNFFIPATAAFLISNEMKDFFSLSLIYFFSSLLISHLLIALYSAFSKIECSLNNLLITKKYSFILFFITFTSIISYFSLPDFYIKEVLALTLSVVLAYPFALLLLNQQNNNIYYNSTMLNVFSIFILSRMLSL